MPIARPRTERENPTAPLWIDKDGKWKIPHVRGRTKTESSAYPWDRQRRSSAIF